MARSDVDRAREDEEDTKGVEEGSLESSPYECIRLSVGERKSLIDRRKSVEDRSAP